MVARRTLTFGSCISPSSSAETTRRSADRAGRVHVTPFNRSLADCCCISESETISRSSRISLRIAAISDAECRPASSCQA
jgi:hypothetical protein